LDGDFNFVLDATVTCTFSRNLAALVQGYALRDVWTQPTANRTSTYYSVTGETRIDRFYVTPTLYEKKVAAETVVAPFIDHHAVILKLGVDVPHAWHGRGLWKLNADLIDCLHNNFGTGMETVEAPTTILPRRDKMVVPPCKTETETFLHEGEGRKAPRDQNHGKSLLRMYVRSSAR